jgi:hypothetical protein
LRSEEVPSTLQALADVISRVRARALDRAPQPISVAKLLRVARANGADDDESVVSDLLSELAVLLADDRPLEALLVLRTRSRSRDSRRRAARNHVREQSASELKAVQAQSTVPGFPEVPLEELERRRLEVAEAFSSIGLVERYYEGCRKGGTDPDPDEVNALREWELARLGLVSDRRHKISRYNRSRIAVAFENVKAFCSVVLAGLVVLVWGMRKAAASAHRKPERSPGGQVPVSIEPSEASLPALAYGTGVRVVMLLLVSIVLLLPIVLVVRTCTNDGNRTAVVSPSADAVPRHQPESFLPVESTARQKPSVPLTTSTPSVPPPGDWPDNRQLFLQVRSGSRRLVDKFETGYPGEKRPRHEGPAVRLPPQDELYIGANIHPESLVPLAGINLFVIDQRVRSCTTTTGCSVRIAPPEGEMLYAAEAVWRDGQVTYGVGRVEIHKDSDAPPVEWHAPVELLPPVVDAVQIELWHGQQLLDVVPRSPLHKRPSGSHQVLAPGEVVVFSARIRDPKVPASRVVIYVNDKAIKECKVTEQCIAQYSLPIVRPKSMVSFRAVAYWNDAFVDTGVGTCVGELAPEVPR